jgi:hypothetical protein
MPREKGTAKAELEKAKGGSVTLTEAELKKLINDAFEEGYEAGNFDHGQNWGDRRVKREADFLAGKEIDRDEDDHEPIAR